MLRHVSAPELRRRSLVIHSIRGFRQEIEHLNEALQKGQLQSTGNWSLDQCCQHLGRWIAFSIDGFPFKYPLRYRFISRLVRLISWRWLVSMALRPGFLNPRCARAIEPDSLITEGDGVKYLLQQVARLENGERMEQPSPVEGRITHEAWSFFHLRHAELHLSYQMIVRTTDKT